MADNFSDKPPIVAPSPTTSRPAGTSKLALLASFVAGAFAAWLIIDTNTNDDPAPIDSPPAITRSAP